MFYPATTEADFREKLEELQIYLRQDNCKSKWLTFSMGVQEHDLVFVELHDLQWALCMLSKCQMVGKLDVWSLVVRYCNPAYHRKFIWVESEHGNAKMFAEWADRVEQYPINNLFDQFLVVVAVHACVFVFRYAAGIGYMEEWSMFMEECKNVRNCLSENVLRPCCSCRRCFTNVKLNGRKVFPSCAKTSRETHEDCGGTNNVTFNQSKMRIEMCHANRMILTSPAFFFARTFFKVKQQRVLSYMSSMLSREILLRVAADTMASLFFL